MYCWNGCGALDRHERTWPPNSSSAGAAPIKVGTSICQLKYCAKTGASSSSGERRRSPGHGPGAAGIVVRDAAPLTNGLVNRGDEFKFFAIELVEQAFVAQIK